ncbi:amino acid/amide ABC transporter substrate-binding protein (HAAT family) [Haloactinopolyspora alba]|uniref:Amino acid/amide ABC transporter substrate-binding protein (HAAT family) n=1 Tax=Haloactinopolyspora alba TaxID=648780 RepID=A0A2P8E3N6_9ACTN|nr:ABC transporter substrate-binding protein [Haloactinopolyspora alba]PSL04083.1 amino acid/amide ABC transporter substrate-binding protein (HAAT family) [Haloactinopolyspora alba]
MRRPLLWRGVALAGAAALTLGACGDDGGGSDGTAEPTEDQTQDTGQTDEPQADVDVERPGRDEVLDLGYVLPESGPLAFLGAPMITGANMALEDINAAGGVLGSDVTLTTGDEAGDAALAQQAAARLINSGVDGVLGAAASGMSQEIIQLLYDNQIVQCSPANTSPSFSEQENNGFYHRTVPPDAAVAPIIADTVVADGAQNVAVVARADDYGVALADLVETNVQNLGGSVATRVDYDPNTSDFSAEVSQITGANPDAVVIIGFGEAATLIRQLIEAGVPANAIYGSDGLFGPTLTQDVNPDDPGFISGMKVIGASGGEEFNNRLNERLPDNEKGNLIYGGQAYDCMIIMALGAIAADSTDPVDFNETVNAVTKDGTECSTFANCSELLASGEDIDYQGVSGPLNIQGTDPAVGRYAIAQFQDDGSLEVVGSQDVDLTQLG